MAYSHRLMARATARPEPKAAALGRGAPEAYAILERAVEEAARLLEADGAMAYLVEGDHLRFACDAGIRNPEARQLIRDLELPLGVGLFGHAASTGDTIVAGDYRRDRRFKHSPVADRIVLIANMRSMAAAPLIAEDQVIGAIGAYSSRIDDFSEAEVALLRALADHAAAGIANQRLIEQFAASEARFRHLVLSSPDLVWETDASGRFTLLSEPLTGLTGWEPSELVGQPWSAIVAPESMDDANATWAGLQAEPTVVRKIRFMLRRREGDPIPAEVYAIGSQRDGAFLGAHGSIRDLSAAERQADRLRDQTEELERLVDAQRTLAEMAAQLTSVREPSDVLVQALRAAVRLLKGSGGQIGMIVTDAGGDLRWGDGHSLVHGRLVPFTKQDHSRVEEGVSGRAVREQHVSWTDDYLADTTFPHESGADASARRLGVRAVIAAPLLFEGEAIGALGVYSERPAAFGAAHGELLGLLAAQATIVLTNARLNARAAVTAEQLERQVEAQRTLGAIAASITSLRDPAAVLARTIDESRRLLHADHVVIHQLVPGTNELADYRDVMSSRPDANLADEVTVGIGQGVAGRAIADRRVSWTGDYLGDEGFVHTERADEWMMSHGYRSQMSAPLIGEEGAPLGAITAYAEQRDAFGAADGELLGALASQAAIVLGNARLYEELQRRIEAQRALGEIAARITAIRDADDLLQRTLDEAVRLLHADGGRIELISEAGELRWAFGHAAIDLPIESRVEDGPRREVEGVAGQAIRDRQVVRTGDYLADESFAHGEAPDRYIRRHGIRSVMSAPLIGEQGAIGSITVHSQGLDAFGPSDADLLEVLASQAAIAVTNAHLYEQLRERVDAQRALASISAEIASVHDAQGVLDRAVTDAARLLKADRAQINLLADGGESLDRPVAAAPDPPSADDVVVPIGSGIAGMAAAERRVRWTGDYLADADFPHDPGDARIEAQDIHSMMSAPLLGPDRLIGTITIQSRATNAFGPPDGELLQLLADQAAIALTNARLYAEVEESERRYRNLVDNSPDIVWSVDASGRFTFFSDSLESRTGWKPEQLLGQPFSVLATGDALAVAAAAWDELRRDPEHEERMRLDLPLPDGRISQTEVAMTALVVEGRFAGAHGAVRDISERERLESDLRDQAAELAASQERAHIARELHDSVTQALFSMGLTLRTLEILLDTDPVAARTKLIELRELQKDALAEMRTLIFELRPSSLETDGLVQALRNHANAVGRRSGLVVVVDAEAVDGLALAGQEALYRIGQEALHNVVKHANASRATIRIWTEKGRVRLSVTDDGIGFDPDAVPRGHIGLIGMRQRADLVAGDLRVMSRHRRGTVIEASVPIHVERASAG